MISIDIEKIKLYYFSYLYFPDENKEKNESNNLNISEFNNLLNNKEIETIELIQQSRDFNKKAKFIYEKNKFKIEFEITNKKLNECQNNFYQTRRELNDYKKDMTITSIPKMLISFNLSNIEFIFYKSNFAAIINNKEKPELYIYLKKFEFECEITRKKYDNEIKYLFPLFPEIDTNNIINNLKFHDVVFCFNLDVKDLFNIMFISSYETKFRIVKNIIIKNLNEDDEDYEKYELNIFSDKNNQDIIWYLLSLVSEHFISYYNLIFFLNKYQKELNDIINKDEFLFIIILKGILRTKYNLSKKNLKFHNPENLYEYIKAHLNEELNDITKKEYDLIKNIYTIDEVRKKYFIYNLIITPLTCEFKIPFLKNGIFLLDKFENEIKSYDLIYITYQKYKKFNYSDLRIDEDISNYYLYYIINSNQCLFNLNYTYIGATIDDMKYQKFWFINAKKCDIVQKKKIIFNSKEENDLFINDILFSEDIAAYLCEYKSIKGIKTENKNTEDINIKNKDNNKRGMISYTLKEKIKEKCKINNFMSCYGIIGNFFGNFSVIDIPKYNNKNRILIKKDENQKKIKKILLKDRILYILNISKFNQGILNNDNINLIDLLKEKNSQSIIKSKIGRAHV